MARIGFTLEDAIRDVSKQYPLIIEEDTENFNEMKSKMEQLGYKQIFFNPAQLLAHNFGSRVLAIKGARGMGKTTFLADRLHGCVATLPKATGTLSGATLKQVFAILMPNLVKSLEQLGMKEGRDFVRGKPNARWKWDKPLAVPRRWENVLSFPNGNITMCISTNSYAPANGLNLGYSLVDEARYANWKAYVESVRPALRGEVYDHPGYRRNENPYYLSETLISDGGVIRKQQEWEVMEDDQTGEINELICEMLAQLKYAEEYDEMHKTNTAWMLANSPKFIEKIQYLRCQSRVFMVFSSLHNISILGEEYIRARQRDMPKLLFDVQILGKKTSLDNSQRFYPNFSMEIHGYTPSQAGETEIIYNKFQSRQTATIDLGAYEKRFDYEAPDLRELAARGKDCTLDVDMIPKKPLFIAHDYNKNCNTVVTAQEGKMDGVDSAIILSSFYVVNPKMLEDLMEYWSDYYLPHQYTCKVVFLYYDSTAKHGQSYASRIGLDDKYAFYNIIRDTLSRRGWNVILINLGAPMLHELKFEFVNGAFAGKERLFPRICAVRNDYLVASLENSMTEMKFGKVHKFKESEKKKSGDGIAMDDELGSNNYTDMSDAFDTLLRGMCRFGTRPSTIWATPTNIWNKTGGSSSPWSQQKK